MKPVYVYVESKQSPAFQFVAFKTTAQAERFIKRLLETCKTLNAKIWEHPLN